MPTTAAQSRSALIVTLAIQILVSFAGLSAPVLAPIASGDIGVAAYLIGAYVSVMYLFAAGAGLACGGFILRYGALRVSQACLVSCAIGLALVAAFSTPLATLVTAAFMGIGYGPVTPASSHILARSTPAARLNLVFSLKQTGVPLGQALAGAVLPGLSLAIGWRGAVLVIALACIVTAAASQPLRRALDDDRQPQRRPLALGGLIGPMRLIFRARLLRLLSLSSFAFAGMQASLGTFLVTYLHDRLGFSVVAAGIVLACAQGAGVGGRILWGFLADRRVRPMTLLGWLGVTMTICAVLVGLFTARWPLAAVIVVCAAYGATAIAWNGVYLAQVARLSPPGRTGEVTGATFFVTFAGVTVVPIVFSAVLGTIGSYMVGYCAVAVLTLASGIALLRSGRTPAQP